MAKLLNIFRLTFRPKICTNNLIYNLSARTLYSDAFLGIDKFRDNCVRVTEQFGSMREKFLVRLNELVDTTQTKANETNLLFSEDLKNIAYLAKDDQDLVLLKKAIDKYNSQSQDLRFSTFIFGPVVLRLCHLLNKSDFAMDLVLNTENQEFYDQLTTYLIFLNLLFENQKYSEVLKVFEHFQNRPTISLKYPRDIVVIALGACYKLNTPESFEFARKVIKGSTDSGSSIVRKGIGFFSALALNQNDPNTALESISLSSSNNYITMRNMRLVALIKLKRFDDVFNILRNITMTDSNKFTTKPILREVLDVMKDAVTKRNDKETTFEFEQIERSLVESNLVQDKTIDSLLCQQIEMRTFDRPADKFDRRSDVRMPREGYQRRDRFNRDRAPQNAQKYQRPGLIDSE